MKVNIRKAKQADLIDIAELWKEFIDYHRNFDSFFARSRNSIYYFKKYAANHIASKKSLVLIAKVQNAFYLILDCYTLVQYLPKI